MGIDPSTKMSAFCIMGFDKKIHDYGKLAMDNLNIWAKKIQQVSVVVIESQYIHRQGSTGLSHSVLKIAEAAGVLKGLAMYLGKRVYSINPKVWQAKMLKANVKSRREILKRLSKEYASAIIGEKVNDSDVSDAILLTDFERQRLANQN